MALSMKRGLLALAAGLMAACGGSASSPSENVTRSSLDGIPATAHSVTVGETMVRFWFDVTPAMNSAVTQGQSVSIRVNCRTTSQANVMITWVFHLLAPDGAIVGDSSEVGDRGGLVNRSVFVNACQSGFGFDVPTSIPQVPFDTIAQLRTRVWVRPSTAPGPVTFLTTQPDALAFDPLNWRHQ